MEKQKVTLEFYGSHHYVQEYQKTAFFCPHCGNKAVWVCLGGGNYYQGSTYFCVACDYYHSLDFTDKVGTEPYLKVIEQLRKREQFPPTTKNGR